VEATEKPHPPCPQDVDGAPGRNKTTGPDGRPCGNGKEKHGGSSDDHGKADGVILIVPFLGSVLGLAGRSQRRLLRRRVSQRSRPRAA
jgi:hypothetical protein